MSRQTVTVGGREETAEFRHELLGRLGLRANASDQDVESAHNGLVEFLELAPHEVKFWATARTTDIDEAFALLCGPEQDLIPAAARGGAQTKDPQDAPPPKAPVPTSAFTPSTPPAPGGLAALAANKPLRKKVVSLAVPLLVIGVVFAVFQMGKSDVPGITGTPTNQTSAAAAGPTAAPLDKAKVGALMQKIAANPKDVAALQGLGDAYFAATDYKNAALWEQKILTVDPKNQVALLALGAAEFNQGNAAAAKKQWLIAAGLYPKVAEVHYDLGFLYLSQTPPDKANMTAEWNKVIAIDPNSAIAKTVATHLKGSQSGPSATPSAK